MIKKKIHKPRYDYDFLAIKYKSLKKYVFINKFGKTTIDF